MTIYCIAPLTAEQHEQVRASNQLGNSFVFLSDMEGELAKLYAGLNAEGTNNPAIFVIDSSGHIVYRYANRKFEIRAKTEDVLTAVHQAMN